MDHEIDPEADLLQKISGDVFHHVIHTVRDAIAPLSNSPENIARRDRDAISRIACLLPANADEANIAGLMARSLGLLKPSVAPEPEPEPEAQPDPVVVALRNRREYDDMDPAEKYATIYPRRAALIRSLGRLPDKCDFGPPDDDLVEAIVASTSPILRELDKPVAH